MMNKKPEKFMGVYLDEEKINDFHLLALKERKKLKELHKEVIEDYLKKHGDGNPQYTIDQFDDKNFMATPAFFRDGLAWKNYLSKQDSKELNKIKSQILLIEKQMMPYL